MNFLNELILQEGTGEICFYCLFVLMGTELRYHPSISLFLDVELNRLTFIVGQILNTSTILGITLDYICLCF